MNKVPMRQQDEKLWKEILSVSNRLKKMGGYKENRFILHCRTSVREELGESFEIGDYSYRVIVDDKLSERQNKDGSYETDVFITMDVE